MQVYVSLMTPRTISKSTRNGCACLTMIKDGQTLSVFGKMNIKSTNVKFNAGFLGYGAEATKQNFNNGNSYMDAIKLSPNVSMPGIQARSATNEIINQQIQQLQQVVNILAHIQHWQMNLANTQVSLPAQQDFIL